METEQINNNVSIEKVLEFKKEQIKRFTEELINTEWELLEFNLFISSCGQSKLNKATKQIQSIRNRVDSGKLNLEKYEKLCEDF